MQYLALPLVLALFGASEPPPSPLPLPNAEPSPAIRELRPDFLAGDRCRDGRRQTGSNPDWQPRLDRRPANPGTAQMMYAVDRRIDGCSVVMVMGEQPPPNLPFGRIRLSPEQKAVLWGER